MIKRITVKTKGQGLYELTEDINKIVRNHENGTGLCTLFVQHTSASLTVQENADSSARRDLEDFLCRLVPEGDPHFTHTLEGADDMPAHIRSALTLTSLSVPFERGKLVLGTWQGIYLWEHRRKGRARSLIVHLT